jgi:serine/threonine protein kinase
MKCPRCQFDNPADTNYCAKCGLPLFRKGEEAFGPTLTLETPVSTLERGGTFADRYEIIEEVGKGGMGRVYKAFDKKIKENIALKLLKPEIASESRTIDRFRNELKFARKIAHPHVCRMYDLGEVGQMHFITMEYVSGEDLKSFIRRAGHLTEPKALSIAEQIAEGLAEAHRLGVLHRDLKPQNVMIDRDGNAKIMDFGIARSLYAAGFTGSGIMVGTPEYMSPEQAEASEVDQRSDLYSLGIIIYEMVTGRVPFTGETPLSVALKQKVETPRDPRELNSMISEGLSGLILKCLEKDKDKRYQSAAELRADLDRIERGLPTVEREAIRKKPAQAEKSRRRPSVWQMALLAFALAILSGLAAMIISRISWHAEKNVPPGLEVVSEKPASPQGHGLPLEVRPFIRNKRSSPPAPPAASPTGTARSADRHISESIAKWLDKLTGGNASGAAGTSAIIGPLLRAAIEDMKPEDLDAAQKQMERVRQFIPRDDTYQALWNDAYAKIKESRRHREAGQPRESQKSLAEGQNQMRKLLDLVDQREKADSARSAMELAKDKAGAVLPAGVENPLYRLASLKAQDAADAYAKEDFSGAATLYRLLTRIYELSPAAGNEEAGASLVRSYLKEIKTAAIAANAAKLASWHYREAGKEEANAEDLMAKKDYAGAADAYLRSAFLYEKAREKTPEPDASK